MTVSMSVSTCIETSKNCKDGMQASSPDAELLERETPQRTAFTAPLGKH